MTKFLNDRQKGEKMIRNELKSRSLTIIDPYGDPVSKKYMDHELISTVLQKYKKNYVPKYLHHWIKFGILGPNCMSPLRNSELQ